MLSLMVSILPNLSRTCPYPHIEEMAFLCNETAHLHKWDNPQEVNILLAYTEVHPTKKESSEVRIVLRNRGAENCLEDGI